MAEKLPGINYQAPLATDDLEFQQTSNGQEIQERTRLVMAENHGIVDSADPRDLSTTDIDRSLSVSVSGDTLKLDVAPGTAVTACGNWVALENKITLLELTSSSAGAVNVVFIEYETEDGDDRRVNKFNVDVAVRNQRPADNSDVVKVDILSNFINTAQYSPTRLTDIVVLAYVTVNQLADLTLDLAIDLGDNNFSNNRPWFSPTDIMHRDMVGTATATDTNPHGTSLNDLAAGRLTLYQQVVQHGLVLSKDVAVPRYPGLQGSEDLSEASFDVDTSGSVTRQSSQFGGVGARYANLDHFPVNLTSVYATGSPALQVSADVLPNSNIIVIPANEPVPAEGVTVEYVYAQAGEGPTDPNTNDLVFLQPANSELIVADGIAVSAIPTPVISFDGSGPIPRNFRVLLDSDGDLISTPQIMVPPIKLDAIGLNTALAVTRSMRGNAPIEIGLTRATNIAGMEIVIQCTGLDEDGGVISRPITFQNGVYADSVIPAQNEEIKQFVRTSDLFSELTQIEVTSRTNDGNDATIIVYESQEAAVTDTFKEKCPLADVFWDGLAVESVLDARPVSLNLDLPKTPIYNGTGSTDLGTRPWAYEDFRKPRFSDAFDGDEDPIASSGSIDIVANGNILLGDTIDLGNGKTLTAKVPVGASGSVTALDIGITIALGDTNLIVAETGFGNISITVTTGNLDINALTSEIASSLTFASGQPGGAGVVYTAILSPQRVISITTAGPTFSINASTLQARLGFSIGGAPTANRASVGQPGITDSDTFILSDGVTTETFEIDTGGGTDPANIAVNSASNAIASEVRTDIITAVSGTALTITSNLGAGSTIDFVNTAEGPDGNIDIVESILTGYSMNPVGMSNGSLGGASASVGEFNVGADGSETAANIVITLADPIFDSGVTGLAAGSSVDLSMDLVGSNNNLITGTFGNPSSVDLSGFGGGAGRYLSATPDAFSEGLHTDIPVIGTDLDSVRTKYRSRSIGVPVSLQGTDVEKIAVVLHNPENLAGDSDPTYVSSVRVKAAFESDPGNWQGFNEMSLFASNPNFAVFQRDFGAAIDKVQFEMYGDFTDFALSDITNVATIGIGPTGAAGPAGLDGADGATGDVGTVGPAGSIGATGPAAEIFSAAFTSSTLWTVVHGQGTTDVVWAAYDSNGEAIIPDTVDVVDGNTVTMTFSVAVAGTAVIVGVS
jgi:hypothetical protein